MENRKVTRVHHGPEREHLERDDAYKLALYYQTVDDAAMAEGEILLGGMATTYQRVLSYVLSIVATRSILNRGEPEETRLSPTQLSYQRRHATRAVEEAKRLGIILEASSG